MPHVAQEGARSGGWMHGGHGMMRMGMSMSMGSGCMMMCRMHSRRKIAMMMMPSMGIGMCRIRIRHAHLMLMMMMMMTVKRMLAKAAAQLGSGCLCREAREEHRIRCAGGTWRNCSRCGAGIIAGIAASAQQKVT